MYLESAKILIEQGKKQGIIQEGEKGALIVKFENEKYPPYLLQKADGTTLYSTRDLAALKDRIERFRPRKIVYVVDIAQSLHFQQLFATARKFSFPEIEKVQLIHVIFGRMQLPEGKMSTRSGDVILLEEVLHEAVERTKKIINEKSPHIAVDGKEYLANSIAVSALKYNIICQNRETNIIFDWDKMLALDGNSAPYLQYAYARAKSILRKAGDIQKPKEPVKSENQISLFHSPEAHKQNLSDQIAARPFHHELEKKLLRLLVIFPEIIEQAVRECRPNIVTNYLFELARTFSSFYSEVQVISVSDMELKVSRLRLVEAFSQVLHNGLKVLGIAVFEKM